MRSSWNPSERSLGNYAAKHVAYEVRVMLQQANLLARNDPGGIADATGDALLEAFLVHVRLLDEFLGSGDQTEPPGKNPQDTAFARHWLPTWKPRHFLTETQRNRVNGQLAHLAARRWHRYEWKVQPMAERCCSAFTRFLDQLDKASPKRAKAFEQVRQDIRDFRAVPAAVVISTTTMAPPTVFITPARPRRA